ncbi:MAG: ABC transporter permease [Capsulimonadaceae bacterium]
MLETLRTYACVSSCFIRLALQRQLEYPLFIVTWLITNPMQYLAGMWMLKAIVTQFHALAGWDVPQIAFLYGLGLLSHGVMVLLFMQTWLIDDMISQGEFDRILLRPLSATFQFSMGFVNLVGLTDLIPAVIIFWYGCRLTHFALTLPHAAIVLLVVFGGTLIRAAFFIILGSVAFWTQRSAPLTLAGEQLIQRGTFYPIAIYPRLMQMLLTFLVPLGFVSFYPTCHLVGGRPGIDVPASLGLWTPAVGIVFFWVSQQIFTAGLRRYEGAGS